jgi:hypothetical protein
VVNNGYGVVDMNILINNLMDIDIRDIDLGNIDTVGTIVTMAIVYFSWSQGYP